MPAPPLDSWACTARRVLLASVAAVAAALALAGPARADIITSHDAQGRTITFDVVAEGVDVEWYAGLLRAAAHGDEISTVTIRVVPPQDVARFCGAEAEACYSGVRSTMVVPAGRDDRVAWTFLHEYGHHLDRAWSVDGVREPNGTPVWWAARRIADLLQAGSVAFDYSRGWSRSIGEIFAEDYAAVHLPGPYSIWWLAPPDEALRTALLTELGGTALPPPPATPTSTPTTPLVITRSGVLAPRGSRAVPFGLLGPGRRVTLTVTAAQTRTAGRRLTVTITCNGRVVGRRAFARTPRRATIEVRNIGPATCQATVSSTSRVAQRYTLRLRLALEEQLA